VYVYRLKNAQALNVESVLNSLFNGTAITNRTSTSNAETLRNARSSAGGFASSSRTGGSNSRGGTTGSGFGTTGGTFGQNTGRTQTFGGNRGGNQNVSANAQQAASDLAGQVSIIADTDTNSLLIRTAPANYERVKMVLDEMDKPVRQVLIKVLIAEVTHSNGTDIGAELSALNVRPDRTDPFGNINSDRGLSGGGNFGIPVNGTGLVVQLLETNFEATIRALETTGKLDVLSRPYILASDNQLASITVGQEVPLIDSSRITDNGQTINTLNYQDVGILLDVIASINPDGLVILDVAPEISTLTGDSVPISDTASQPIIAKRSAQTRVGVRSGRTIVIGGLMEDRVTESVNKVPILGDIPLLGEAFKRTIKNKAKTELLIFLTPHVATDPDQIPDMSKQEVEGTKLLPGAIGPGVYDEHKQGLKRGDPTTQPVTPPEPKE
jgi:general secretion pathway protein D